mmetsp:Transcript_12433/g.14281  ORF Transcript_12433/g.14281 Transcript_12433/m.14281 type:complete len:80 (-) Transcript_12433:1993-2232(-)
MLPRSEVTNTAKTATVDTSRIAPEVVMNIDNNHRNTGKAVEIIGNIGTRSRFADPFSTEPLGSITTFADPNRSRFGSCL